MVSTEFYLRKNPRNAVIISEYRSTHVLSNVEAGPPRFMIQDLSWMSFSIQSKSTTHKKRPNPGRQEGRAGVSILTNKGQSLKFCHLGAPTVIIGRNSITCNFERRERTWGIRTCSIIIDAAAEIAEGR
jgi:hypothetical protein